jgi:2-C-methyl-D-erythritol 4-phosphate cytidylyltransferase
MGSSTSSGPDVRAVALLLAAGSGERLGLSMPKAFASLGGRSILEISFEGVASVPHVDGVILVVPAERLDEAAELRSHPKVLDVVAGGRTRQESVALGLGSVPESARVVLCHDAARPFASPRLFARVIDALGDGREAQGSIPVVAVSDTVKRVRGGLVSGTVPRHDLALVQTPQAFEVDAFRDAHARSAGQDLDATDDAMLLEAAGYTVVAVEGEPGNFKITSPEDLRRAELVLAATERPS